MTTFFPRALAVLVIASVGHTPAAMPTPPRITILSGSRSDGGATDLWLAILRRRLSEAEYDSVAPLRRPWTPEHDAWAQLVAARATHWPQAVLDLQQLFDSTHVDSLLVVLGNRGAEDAFTHDSMTIGFDLAALQRVYGSASGSENPDRLDRIFRHEFSHLLQKRWLAHHPFTPTSPLETALLDAWAEGLGNYFSLSARFRPMNGTPSPLTVRTLERLQPAFAARMAALACADSIAAIPLLAGLSSGPFEQKWGALPVALWLLMDSEADSGALHAFANAGPAAVWSLAERHLPTDLAASLAAPRSCQPACTGMPPTARGC